VKLSWVQSKKYTGWTKWIGRTPEGKPKCFYLGKDQTEAELKAIRLALAYKALRAAGKVAWTDDAIDAALTGSASVTHTSSPDAPADPPANTATTTEPKPVVNGLTLHDAFAAYLKREEARAPGETTYAYLHGQRIRVKRLKSMMRDKPLAEVGYDDLARLVSHAASRPVSKTTKKRISLVTAVDTIKGARTIFDWLDISERWIAPRRFERIFGINRKSLVTPEERARQTDGVETFTVEELVKIMQMAWTRWHRAFIRASLNLAMTQWELSCLSREHLKGFDTTSPKIEKFREKTTIFCRWGFVFPEVVEDMKWLMQTHDHDLVFVGPNGLPPVRFHSTGRTDTVSSWWSRLVKRAEVRPLTFRYLRKTAADKGARPLSRRPLRVRRRYHPPVRADQRHARSRCLGVVDPHDGAIPAGEGGCGTRNALQCSRNPVKDDADGRKRRDLWRGLVRLAARPNPLPRSGEAAGGVQCSLARRITPPAPPRPAVSSVSLCPASSRTWFARAGNDLSLRPKTLHHQSLFGW
jgi:hypothetical protein